jgi:uncharacterized protein YrrD
MIKMELREGTEVFTPAGKQVGKVNGFVLDPATNEVTHIIVQKGWLLPEDKVLSFDIVQSASEDKVVLNEDIGDFDELPAFEEAHYIQTRDADVAPGETPAPRDRLPNSDLNRGADRGYSYAPAYYWYPPHGFIGYPVGYYGWPPMETVRNIPEDTIPLKEGTDVMSSDGEHVGDVQRLYVEPESNQATHFVISQGMLFKDRKLVPAHWVKSVSEEKVQLAVTSALLERLPSFEE